MKNKLLNIRLSQIIIAVIISLFAVFGELTDDGLMLNDFLKYLPPIFGISIVILALFELFYCFPIVRLLYLLLTSSISIAFALNGDGIYEVDAVIWVFTIIYFVLTLISLSKLKKIPLKKKSKPTLPSGFYAAKDMVCFAIFGLVFYVTAFFCAGLGYIMESPIFLIFIVVILFVLGFIFSITNKLSRTLNKFSKTADYEGFMKEVDKIIENNNLHTEAIKHLRLLQVNYSFLADKEKAFEIFTSIEEPTGKNYKMFYKVIEILYYVNQDNFEKAKELFSDFEFKYPRRKKQILGLKNTLINYGTTEEIKDVEKKYPMKSTKVNNLIYASALMTYYKRRNNIQKAKYYACYIKNNTTQFHEIIKEAEEVIKTEE